MPGRIRAVLEMASNITTEQLTEALAKQTADIVAKLDSKISTVRLELLEEVKQVQFECNSGIENNSKEIENLKIKLDTLELETLYSRIADNTQQQRNRAPSIKIFNFPVPAGSDHQRAVYDTFIVPAMDKAVAAKQLSRTPELDETLEFGHVLKSFTKDSTPSIVCRFKSRNFKKIWREHSGGVIADYNKKMSDNWKKPTLFPTLRIGNDLTKANRRVMSQLYDDKTVSKVRLGNQVQFQLASSPTTWRSVHNPFTDNIAKMQIEIKSVYHNPLLN